MSDNVPPPSMSPRLWVGGFLPQGQPQRWWLLAIATTSVFMLLCTLLLPWLPGSVVAVLRIFNLREESNLGALWSAMLLLLAAMHAFDGWLLHRGQHRSVARAWLLLSAALIALSFDETGSFHERFTWLGLLPIALLFGSMFAYTVVVLFRQPEHRASAIMICVAFFLFGSVALQEVIEHAVNWPDYLRSVRAAVEEGTELLAMVVLVRATMPNTQGMLGESPERNTPAFDAVLVGRTPLAFVGVLAAPVIAYVAISLDQSYTAHGVATEWPVAACFFLATLGALRPVYSTGASIGWRGWGVAGIGALGCGASILHESSVLAVSVFSILAIAAALLWAGDPRYRWGMYLPVTALIVACLSVAYLWVDDPLVPPIMIQYVALGFFVVASNPRVGANATGVHR